MAASGEEIIIARAGKPMARLVPYVIERQPRKGGFFRGNIQEFPDCWETDDELIAAMTGGNARTRTRQRQAVRIPLDSHTALWWMDDP